MLYTPKNKKFKKYQKGKTFNKITNVKERNRIRFGSIALKIMEFGRLDSIQLLSFKQTLTKLIKRIGKLKINVFPHQPITAKPLEVRMGKGKGNIDSWVAKLRPGMLLCEIESKTKLLVIKALNISKKRLPINTKIVFE